MPHAINHETVNMELNNILPQILLTFSKPPGLDGILHGQRNIKQGKHGSRSSLFFSRKNGALLPVESNLEKTFCYHLEVKADVKSYRTQALKIPYLGGSLFPDFLISHIDGSFSVVEVKAAVFANSPRTLQRAAYIGEVLAREGIPFCLVTEDDFLPECELDNLILLYDRGGKYPVEPSTLVHIGGLAATLPSDERTVAKMREAIADDGLHAHLLEAALFAGILKCDMAVPFAPSTLIGLNHE